VDPNAFHAVTRDGTITTLPDPADVAFRPPGPYDDNNVSGCVTEFAYRRALVCIPPLTNPPKKPDAPGRRAG